MPRGPSHRAQSWRPSCWDTWNPVITELSTMPAGSYNFCPFVQGWWWVSCSYHRLLCKADITSPCATLVLCCTPRYAPIDFIWLVVVLKSPIVLGQLSFLSATLCTELVGVTIEARFERALCQTWCFVVWQDHIARKGWGWGGVRWGWGGGVGLKRLGDPPILVEPFRLCRNRRSCRKYISCDLPSGGSYLVNLFK